MANSIYIRLAEVGNTSSKFTFPANPESVQASLGTKYQSLDIISQGTVKIPKGTDVATIKWNGVFFGSSKKKELVVLTDYYQTPATCISKLRKWQEAGTVLNLIVAGTWINMDVTISSLEPENTGGYGNVEYSIESCQYKELKIYTTSELKIASFVKKTVSRTSTSSTTSSDSTYTIVSGDTLWGIAKKKLGSGSKWTTICSKNKSTIEAAAKKHGKSSSGNGHWIYPGTVLTIPSAA